MADMQYDNPIDNMKSWVAGILRGETIEINREDPMMKVRRMAKEKELAKKDMNARLDAGPRMEARKVTKNLELDKRDMRSRLLNVADNQTTPKPAPGPRPTPPPQTPEERKAWVNSVLSGKIGQEEKISKPMGTPIPGSKERYEPGIVYAESSGHRQGGVDDTTLSDEIKAIYNVAQNRAKEWGVPIEKVLTRKKPGYPSDFNAVEMNKPGIEVYKSGQFNTDADKQKASIFDAAYMALKQNQLPNIIGTRNSFAHSLNDLKRMKASDGSQLYPKIKDLIKIGNAWFYTMPTWKDNNGYASGGLGKF